MRFKFLLAPSGKVECSYGNDVVMYCYNVNALYLYMHVYLHCIFIWTHS